MAATKKRTAAAKSGAARQKSTGTRARSAQSRSEAERIPAETRSRQTKPAEKQARPMNNQFWSVILFATGILVLILAFIPGEKAWYWLHNALLGIFGVGVFLVPVILGYTGILVGQSRSREASGRAVWGVLLTLFCSTFVQLFFGVMPTADPLKAGYENFLAKLTELWTQGTDMRGGGVISGVIALPLTALFGEIGAKILIILLIIVLMMLLTQRSIVEVFKMLASPFVWLGKGVATMATRGLDAYEDDEEYDDPSEQDGEPVQLPLTEEPLPDDAPAMHFERGRTRKARKAAEGRQMDEVAFMLDGRDLPAAAERYDNIDDFLLDVPISGAAPEPEEINRLEAQPQSGVEGYNMSEDEEADLARLVADAEKEPAEGTNRLPWMLDDPDGENRPAGAPDAGIYDEEPVIPYVAPPLTLLKRADNSANDAEKSAELREKAGQLVETLASFGVSVRITGIRRGPSVTRYEIQPAAGVKISKITALADDIGLNMGGKSVRIEAPIPGKPAVGVEVPNNTKDMVSLREILESQEFQDSESRLTFAVGKDIDGNVILGDIAKMPHMIIAGTTGSGKSVCTNSIIMSILYHASPDEVRMVLIDPKVVEFQPYDGIPHLLIPVVTNPQKAAGALNWAVLEMEKRYALCAQYGVRDLRGYNAVADKNPELKRLPQILIIIDEFADLMMTAGKEVEASVVRIAQKARAAGIHLVIATQRPTVDVITGLIKSNVPSRIGMSVKSAQDSRIILDCSGAETLLGNGDLLFFPNGAREPRRVQGCFTSDGEVEAVTPFLKSNGASSYDEEIMDAVEQNAPQSKLEKADEDTGELTGDEALIVKAAELAVDAGQLSTTSLQRRLKLGYAKAARIVDELEERGIIGPSEGAKPRRVLMSPQELTEWKLRLAAKGGHIDSSGM